MLLEAGEGSRCSLEVLDDVAEQTTAGTTKLGQSKSALTTNPVADRAIPLWKTLFNWPNPVIQADEDILLPIIINLRLVCGSGSPQADIEAAISRGPVSAKTQ